MKRGQYLLILILAILGGFVGGAVVNRFFTTQPVFAQKKSKPAKVIEAEEFRLVDKSGNIHVEIKLKEFTVSPTKPPVKRPVTSIKQNGRDRVTLGLSWAEAPVLMFSDPNGRAHLSLSLTGAGREAIPGIDLYNQDGMVTLAVHPFPVGPHLNLFDTYTKAKATLGIGFGWKRMPFLFMRDKDEKLRVSLELKEKGEPSLTLYDKAGTPRAILGSTELETIHTGILQKRPASSLALFDKEGKVIWSVP